MTDKSEAITEVLLPCPFCGRTNKLKLKPYRADDDGGEPFDWGFTVQCDASGFEDNPNRGCGASGAWGETEDEARAEWNRRAAPPPPSVPVGVKGLEWRELSSPREDGPADLTGEFEALCVFGAYSVVLDTDEDVAPYQFCVWSPEDNLGHFASADAAKAAAQADYEQRVRSALEPAPSAAPPSREEGLREAATAIDRFNRSIDSIEVRCMAADGPVTPTLEEMTDAELADIWADLQTIRRALSHANGGE